MLFNFKSEPVTKKDVACPCSDFVVSIGACACANISVENQQQMRYRHMLYKPKSNLGTKPKSLEQILNHDKQP
jgi:hypothetical protein